MDLVDLIKISIAWKLLLGIRIYTMNFHLSRGCNLRDITHHRHLGFIGFVNINRTFCSLSLSFILFLYSNFYATLVRYSISSSNLSNWKFMDHFKSFIQGSVYLRCLVHYPQIIIITKRLQCALIIITEWLIGIINYGRAVFLILSYHCCLRTLHILWNWRLGH